MKGDYLFERIYNLEAEIYKRGIKGTYQRKLLTICGFSLAALFLISLGSVFVFSGFDGITNNIVADVLFIVVGVSFFSFGILLVVGLIKVSQEKGK